MDDGELRQAARILDSYNKQLESLTRQAKLLQTTRDEIARSLGALDALSKAKKGDEVMVPVGASAYIPVQVTGKNAVVGIGNGVAVEKDLEDSQAWMQAQGDEIAKALGETMRAMQETQRCIQEFAETVQQEYRKRKSQDVR